MNVSSNIIAKRYAIAFLNLYFDQISKGDIAFMLELEAFLKRNKMFYVYLRIPTIPESIKKKALLKILQEFRVKQAVENLIFLLLEDGRIEILDIVLCQVVQCYREKRGIQSFKIITSHNLSENEKEKVMLFVEHLAKNEVITKFLVDEKLIAGFRIQSKNFLWERSVSKQLRDVKKIIFKQVGLW
jgi:F-type H+-transporting ATPase subunit delta